MAATLTRRSSDASRVAEATLATRFDARRVLRRYLARPVIGVFLVVPLLGAILNMGSPSWLLTVSGAAALYLSADLFLTWLRRPVEAEVAAYANLVAWTTGLAVLAAAAWTMGAWQYHGELVALVGVVTGFAVGLGSPRTVAALWTVTAGAAVALGASLIGPLTAEPAMVVAAIAIGTWFGGAAGLIVGRFVQAPRTAPRGTATRRTKAHHSPADRTPTASEPARIQESPPA
jgi:hypothetical protein